MSRNKYPEQTVEKILDAAAYLFAQKGYAHTTLQDVIDETGLSKGAVYHHFKSKEEIAANGYDLSINKYKETEYVPVEYPSTQEILADLHELEMEITKGLAELEEMV